MLMVPIFDTLNNTNRSLKFPAERDVFYRERLDNLYGLPPMTLLTPISC